MSVPKHWLLKGWYPRRLIVQPQKYLHSDINENEDIIIIKCVRYVSGISFIIYSSNYNFCGWHMNSPSSSVRVSVYVVLCRPLLVFCHFSFDHCIVCSSNYGFWLHFYLSTFSLFLSLYTSIPLDIYWYSFFLCCPCIFRFH